MKLAPALVHIEAWFWYMLFLDLLSVKVFLSFLIELIEQILNTIKVDVSIPWFKVALYKYFFPPIFHLKTAVTFLILHKN
jgi:hypothetical protein